MFVPFGFLIPLLWKDVKYKVLTIGLIVITAIEALQLIINRTFGLVEIVMEFIGVAAGFVLFMLLFPLIKLWLYPEKKGDKK
ncbi:MAG: VanZ family protein [Clostridia bacterium]|nr:VanZ family protein [Clostridia bacterium]